MLAAGKYTSGKCGVLNIMQTDVTCEISGAEPELSFLLCGLIS